MAENPGAFQVAGGGVPATGGTFLCQTDDKGVLHCFDVHSINLMASASSSMNLDPTTPTTTPLPTTTTGTTTPPPTTTPLTTTGPTTTTTTNDHQPSQSEGVYWPGVSVSATGHQPISIHTPTSNQNLKPGANGINPTDTAAVTEYVRHLQDVPHTTTNGSTANTTILPSYTPSGSGVAIANMRIGWHPHKPDQQITHKIDLIQFTAYHYSSDGVPTPVLGSVTIKEPYNQKYLLNGELNLQKSKKHAVSHSFRGYTWRTECTTMTKKSPSASVSIAFSPAKYVHYVLVRAFTGGEVDTKDWALYVTQENGDIDIYPFEGHASQRGLNGRDEYYDFML